MLGKNNDQGENIVCRAENGGEMMLMNYDNKY